MGEILRATGELLVQSFWGLIVPAMIWIWNWVIVGALWLVIGGAASLPLTIWFAKRLHDRLDWWPVRVVVWILAVMVLWFYAHLWTASALWFVDHIVGAPYEAGLELVIAACLAGLWFLGFLISSGMRDQTVRNGVRRNL